MSMFYIGRFLNNFKDFYNEINGATLTGAIDVVAVEQPDGTYNCSPFHVRFGKIGVLRSREKVVDIEINGEPRDIHMKLGESGEAFFVEEVFDTETEEIPEHLATSPIPVSHFEHLYNSKGRRRNSIDLGDKKPVLNLENQVNDYSKRRNTTDNDNEKRRGHDFIKRQIGLGNIEIGENSMEDLTLSLQSTTKESIDDLSKDNDISDTIFKMDSLDHDSKSESTTPNKEEVKILPPVSDPPSETKGAKKRRRKKSVMKKKGSQRKISNVTDTPTPTVEPNEESNTDLKGSDTNTERSSLEGSPSEAEAKEASKADENTSSVANRKVPMDPDFHFFSDTELTTGQSDSRPNTPIHIESVQSDTEFEVQKSKDDNKENEQQSQSWAWGEFPKNMSQTNTANDEKPGNNQEEQHNSMLSNMFSFMKQTKHRRRNSKTEGVYLADLSSGAIDPEVANLYFTTNSNKQNADADMDCESGNGPSLTQSPNSVEGSKSIDSDFDEQNKLAQTYMHDISLSMCGWEPEPVEDTFLRHVVAFSDLCNNPSLFESPNLVVRIRNKYYNWKVAAPIISSLIIYQRPLPQSTVDQLINIHMPSTNNAIGVSQEKEQKTESRSWMWMWRRSRNSRETTPAADLGENKGGDKEVSEEVFQSSELTALSETYELSQDALVEQAKDSGVEDEKPILLHEGVNEPVTPEGCKVNSEKCRKTLRLSSSQIKKLNLRNGMNEVVFSVTTAYQGTTRCSCHIYKWKWDDKIVISDIDGTITKSDVLGHILPIVGNDWSQTGVAQLFNKIKDNGYKLLYLSARAIGQARTTREYIKSIKQGDLYMPDGPILLNPTSLINAFHREVIEKKPEQFKISCMSDIKALFPIDSNPFYAGYGNRINDVWAYRAVGIPIVRIFTINPKGELKHELTQTFQSSYSGQFLVVNDVFPPIINKIISTEIDDDDVDDSDSSSSSELQFQ
ncbi:PREDICTED: phosphatidate phosphatase LPIN3 isoform X1 [Nicrophorus vespilloides]|uniref:phosphatidate phosphatase n=1 Tax=Nicrophorus vespilloides TaxID=110193 RepID=A0ABM1MCN6_NICVS|nr:PREDICTED: phosphatidate phosphatase LPIN3 isoform X1 [Nicrophorus vespilloides]XP_017772335.1 PREDICTED: phosphatidate phosphatase LPIN3 isoform X1 [Nicrophorus vespilloides]XP_017772336.1 PREDICTED: phosphatidate phosphatase LPIN3 isoform X1 [Nicrophorus vespilloides]XP_017772337.1 PREDICTED: phosphatidate phosphatase LPIN3 isoform X1 [Nicrophorus vespilloides]